MEVADADAEHGSGIRDESQRQRDRSPSRIFVPVRSWFVLLFLIFRAVFGKHAAVLPRREPDEALNDITKMTLIRKPTPAPPLRAECPAAAEPLLDADRLEIAIRCDARLFRERA